MPEFDKQPSAPGPNEFDSGDDTIDDDLKFRASFAETLTEHGYPDTLVLARERAEDVFHDRRLEILDYLKKHDPESVRALATAVGHDKGVVSRDLQRLAQIDVIEYVDAGRSKAPRLKHNHVVVEPVV